MYCEGIKLFSKIKEIFLKHIRSNSKTYFFLLLAFIVGVSAGAFTVNGLSTGQRDELTNYFQGFLQLLGNQKIDSSELLRIAVFENLRIVTVLWVLGVTIIGIPFVFILIGIRGFITGFSSGFIIETMGVKGILVALAALLPKEIIIVPCIIAMGVSGINFSLNIIKSRSKHLSKESLKTSFFAYCTVTILYTGIIFAGILMEAYVTPVFIRLAATIVGS